MSTSNNSQPGLLNQFSASHWAVLIVLSGGAILSLALILEHGFDMSPCPLCLMQRIWIFFAALMAYLSLLHNPQLGIYPLLTLLCCAVGAYFSTKQLHLQSLPADQVPACGPDLQYMFEVFPLSEVIASMTRGTGDCAKVSFRLLGLTLPGWSLVTYAALALFAIGQWRAALKGLR